MVPKFIRDLFTEDGSKWSLTRFTSAACVVSAIAWVSVVVHSTHTLPDLTSPAIFVTGGAAHLGVGKWSEWAHAKLAIGNGSQATGSDSAKG